MQIDHLGIDPEIWRALAHIGLLALCEFEQDAFYLFIAEGGVSVYAYHSADDSPSAGGDE